MQYLNEGATSRRPSAAAAAASRSRRREFAATPPVKAIVSGAKLAGGRDRGPNQHLDHGFLKARGEVGWGGRTRRLARQKQGDGGFDSAETEIERRVFDAGAREFDLLGISLSGQFIDDAAARIAEAHHLRDFVESLAGGIVASRAEAPVVAEILDGE